MISSSDNLQQYSKGAIWLHWLIAFVLAAEIAIGFTMPEGVEGFQLFQLHKSLGITVLVLTVLRLVWRFTHKRPAPIEGGATGFLAKAVHVLFYAFLILAPLSGWAVVSSAPIDVPTMLFGVVPWPHLPVAESLNGTVAEAHEILAFIGLALFVLHVVGALRHHYLLGDKLLARMAPGGAPFWTLALGTGVIALGAAVFFAIGPRQEEHDHTTDHEEAGEAHEHRDDENAIPAEEVAQEEAHDHGEHEHADEEEAEEEIAEVEAVQEASEAQAAAPEPAGPPPQWAIQPGGSLRFTVDNGGEALNGSFGNWSGQIAMDPANPQTAAITINVQLGSASLGDATQDGMLGGEDFFSAETFPTAIWTSSSVTSQGDGNYLANGTLTLKGVTAPQQITFRLSGSGNSRAVTGRAVVNRNAFGVGIGDAAASLGGNVTVSFSFDAVRQ